MGKRGFHWEPRPRPDFAALRWWNTGDLTPAGPPGGGKPHSPWAQWGHLGQTPTYAHTGSPDTWQEKDGRPGGRPAAGLGHLAGRGKTVPAEGPAGSSRARNRRAMPWKWLGRSHQERGRPHPQRRFQTRRGASTPAGGHPHLQKEGASSPPGEGHVHTHGRPHCRRLTRRSWATRAQQTPPPPQTPHPRGEAAALKNERRGELTLGRSAAPATAAAMFLRMSMRAAGPEVRARGSADPARPA